MSDFGDFDPDDAYGTEGPDPEQVARRLYEFEGGRWLDLRAGQIDARIQAMAKVIDWLRREGAVR